jgi:hypothetical protein
MNKLGNGYKILQTFTQWQMTIKLYHFQTDSYDRHKITDNYLSKYLDHLDEFMEIYQGAHGKIQFPKNITVSFEQFDIAGIFIEAKKFEKYLIKELPKLIDKEDSDLLNLRDEILGSVRRMVYLLRQTIKNEVNRQ